VRPHSAYPIVLLLAVARSISTICSSESFMTSKGLSAIPAASEQSVLPIAQRKVLGAASLVAGLLCIFFVGFAPMVAVHNAAHDTRHSAAFPCH
jgi:cobalt transporter subunit CbtB